MYNNDLVSIITPMYNASAYVKDTIESVIKQTYTNWEMIIVDDCSSDDSASIVESFIQKDKRIKLYKQSNNSGIAKSRNLALEKAKGRYVAFLDSDDTWYPNKLNIQIKYMQEKNIHFCHSACDIMLEDGSKTQKVRYVPEIVDYKGLLPGDVIACLTVVIDRNFIANPTMPYIRHEDYAAWLDILKTGEKAYGINEILATYRVSAKSDSGNKIRAAKWNWDIYRKYLKIPFLKSVYYFIGYAFKAVAKRL